MSRPRPSNRPPVDEVVVPSTIAVSAVIEPVPYRVRVLHRANVRVDQVGMWLGKNDVYQGNMAALLWRDAREHVERMP